MGKYQGGQDPDPLEHAPGFDDRHGAERDWCGRKLSSLLVPSRRSRVLHAGHPDHDLSKAARGRAFDDFPHANPKLVLDQTLAESELVPGLGTDANSGYPGCGLWCSRRTDRLNQRPRCLGLLPSVDSGHQRHQSADLPRGQARRSEHKKEKVNVMNILIVDGHPNSESYGRALADSYEEGARSGGAEVQRRSIRELRFDPVLHKGYREIQELEGGSCRNAANH